MSETHHTIDELLEKCETRIVRGSTLRAIGTRLIALTQGEDPVPGAFFGRQYDLRSAFWQTGPGGTTSSHLQQYSEGSILGPAQLVVVPGVESEVEGIFPYTRYILRPKAFSKMYGEHEAPPARMIVTRGEVNVNAGESAYVDQPTIELAIASQVLAGDAVPTIEDFGNLAETLGLDLPEFRQ